MQPLREASPSDAAELPVALRAPLPRGRSGAGRHPRERRRRRRRACDRAAVLRAGERRRGEGDTALRAGALSTLLHVPGARCSGGARAHDVRGRMLVRHTSRYPLHGRVRPRLLQLLHEQLPCGRHECSALLGGTAQRVVFGATRAARQLQTLGAQAEQRVRVNSGAD
jgi:hypothetical protein